MKINNPLTGHGKMIIRYIGNNELMKSQSSQMSRVFMQKSREVDAHTFENMVIETQLFDNTEIQMSLASGKLYYKVSDEDDSFWIHSEPSFVHFSFININNEMILMEGQITHVKEITPEFISNEDYAITLIFKNTNDFIELLDRYEIEYTYHDYSKPEIAIE